MHLLLLTLLLVSCTETSVTHLAKKSIALLKLDTMLAVVYPNGTYGIFKKFDRNIHEFRRFDLQIKNPSLELNDVTIYNVLKITQPFFQTKDEYSEFFSLSLLRDLWDEKYVERRGENIYATHYLFKSNLYATIYQPQNNKVKFKFYVPKFKKNKLNKITDIFKKVFKPWQKMKMGDSIFLKFDNALLEIALHEYKSVCGVFVTIHKKRYRIITIGSVLKSNIYLKGKEGNYKIYMDGKKIAHVNDLRYPTKYQLFTKDYKKCTLFF